MQKAYLSSFGSRVLRGVLLWFGVLVLLAGARTASLGQVWAWGSNDYGALGVGASADHSTPVQVSDITEVVQVIGGAAHSLALKANGSVWAWGYNGYGELGDETNTSRGIRIQIKGLNSVVQIARGWYHSLALKSDGTVRAWGWNNVGQLGDGTNADKNKPVQVSGLTNIVQVAGGYAHSLAVKSDGTVWAWGWNDNGQLGDGTHNATNKPFQVAGISGVMQVAGGYAHSLALKLDGTVWAWGWNQHGEIGDKTTADRSKPVQVTELSGVVQIATGFQHSLAVKSDGTVWAWGFNEDGELGDGTNADKSKPVQVSGLTGAVQIGGGGRYSLAVKSDGAVWSWGYNNRGQLGNGTNASSNVPVTVSSINGQTFVSAGDWHCLSVQAVVLNTTPKPANVTAAYGKSFTLSTTLKNALGGTLINEPVAFMVDGTDVGTANTDASGKAVVLVPASLDRHPGAHTITVSYAGNRLYATSSKDSTLTVTKADTALSVGAVIGTPGVTKNLTATLKSKSDGSALSARTLTFRIDGNIVGTASTDGTGKATLSYKFDETYAVVVQHTLTAEYDGSADADYNSGKGTGALTVNQAPSKVAGSSAIGKAGTTVTLIAVLTRTSDKAPLPGRTVSFAIDGVTVGKAVTDSDGFALLDYAIPAATTTGLHPLSVVFKGDTFYIKSSDGAVWLKVR